MGDAVTMWPWHIICHCQKQKGKFHPSTFFVGGVTLAAGRLVVDDGTLKAYVQRLESIKLKLTQLEQELQRARKQVLLNQDDVSELESGLNILRPSDKKEESRVKPNPSLQVQPIFIDPDPSERANKPKGSGRKALANDCAWR